MRAIEDTVPIKSCERRVSKILFYHQDAVAHNRFGGNLITSIRAIGS